LGTDQYIAEITLFAGNFAPRSTALCQGQIMSIQQNTALFSLLGTTYGGNGTSTFALPDMRGSTPQGVGDGPGLTPYVLGEISGTENITLLTSEMPQHTHSLTTTLNASTTKATLQTPVAGSVFGRAVDGTAAGAPLIYCPAGTTTTVTLAEGNATSVVGGSQPVNIQQPYLGLNFLIYTQGIFPSRN
jgi:microcystin-dependent protein